MGKLQAMHKCFTVILMLACHGVLLTQGRQITSMNHFTTNTETTEHDQNPLQASSGEKKVEAKYDVAASSDSGSDAFRPTTPGSSPGVGHRKFAGNDNDVKAKMAVHSPDAPKDYYATDFLHNPDPPGHSPGVGHVIGNKNISPTIT